MDPKQTSGGRPQSNQPSSGQPGYGQAPSSQPSGQPGYGQPGYPAPGAGRPPYPQAPYAQPQYPPPAAPQPPYVPPAVPQPPYGQPQYPQPPYGQQPYVQPPTGPQGGPQYGQPPYAYGAPLGGPAQPNVVPMGEQWAPGVNPVTVPSRSRRLRWGIAGAVVLCVAIVTTAGAFVLSGAAGAKSLTAGVAPKDSIAFMEVRTDLPGDQHAKLADFMSHFPGFQDRAQFDNALDELLNRITSAVSPDLTYTSAFKPWMEGEISIDVAGMGGAAASPSAQPGMNSATGPGALVIVALRDRAAAQTWVNSEFSRAGIAVTTQDYAGTTIYTSVTAGDSGAYAFTDQDLLLGTLDAVKASIDTKTKGSLAANANYQAAMNSLSGDSLARFYVDAKSLINYELASYSSMSQMMPGALPTLPTLGLSAADAPAWIAGAVRAESDRMVVDVAMPRTGTAATGNHVSALASLLPGNTVGVAEVHSIGKLITQGLAEVQKELPSDQSVQSINSALTEIGGVDWLGDGVVAVTSTGSSYGGGLVVQATDAATASAKVSLIGNFVALAGGSLNLTKHSETYKGVDITLIDIPAQAAGMPVELAVAAKDNVIVAGYTDAFVKAVIDTTSATSLASQPGYSAVMSALGSSNEGSVYVDLGTLVDQLGPMLFAATPSQWTMNYKPYFEHIGGIGSAVVDGNTVILRFVITAK